MKDFVLHRRWYLIILALFLLFLAMLRMENIFRDGVLLLVFIVAGLVILAFLKLGVYRQLLLFLMLLQVFTFLIKITYGVANSTILALLPTIFLGALVFCILMLVVQGKLNFRFSMLDVFVISFFAWDFIQIFNPYLNALGNQDFLIIGLRGFQQRSFLGLIYFIVRWLDITLLRFNTIFRILTYSIALGSLYALIQQFFVFDIFESAYRLEQIAKDPLLEDQFLLRAVGFLGSPFTFGLVSAIGLVCGVYLLNFAVSSKTERVLFVISVALNGGAVIVSGSRSTYFSLLVMCAILGSFMKTALFLNAWRSRHYIGAAMICLLFLLVIFPDSAPVKYSIERINSLNEIFASSDTITDNNFIVRREIIAASESMILSNPFGYGSGIFNGGSNPDGLVNVNGYATFVDNEFVGLALELGVPGVLLFLIIVGMALYRCRVALTSAAYSDRARILAALIVICPIAGVGGQWLAAYPVNIMFWVVLGLISHLPVSLHSRAHVKF